MKFSIIPLDGTFILFTTHCRIHQCCCLQKIHDSLPPYTACKASIFQVSNTVSLSPSLPCYLTKQWPCDCWAAAAWVFPVPVNTQGIITGLLKQISSQQHKGSIYMQVLSMSSEEGSPSQQYHHWQPCVLVCGIHLDKCTQNYTCKTDRSKVCWGQTADAEPRQWGQCWDKLLIECTAMWLSGKYI